VRCAGGGATQRRAVVIGPAGYKLWNGAGTDVNNRMSLTMRAAVGLKGIDAGVELVNPF
jgi:hypothetical protein